MAYFILRSGYHGPEHILKFIPKDSNPARIAYDFIVIIIQRDAENEKR